MAFTPTSVIRKIANDKVDERHKQGENNPHRHGYSPQPPSQQSGNMRPIVKSTYLPTCAYIYTNDLPTQDIISYIWVFNSYYDQKCVLTVTVFWEYFVLKHQLLKFFSETTALCISTLFKK